MSIRRLRLDAVDPERPLVLVREASGRVAAIALRDGTIAWRTEEACVPLWSAEEGVVAAKTTASRELALVWIDRPLGTTRPATPPVALPSWLDPSVPDALELFAERAGETLAVRWEARRSYRGGAAPSARAIVDATRASSGTVNVALRSADEGARAVLGFARTSSAEAPSVPSSDAAVLEALDAGELLVELRGAPSAAGRPGPSVRAIDKASGAIRWETPLTEPPPSRRPPLRP